MERFCAFCGTPFQTAPYRHTRYCGRLCSNRAPRSEERQRKHSEALRGKPKSAETRALMSAATKGKPRPWQQGEGNPNFGGATVTEVSRRRMSETQKLLWPEARCHALSAKMRGMAGTPHTPETKAKMSGIMKRKYQEGTVKLRKYSISQAEQDIAEWLRSHGIEFKPQYHIPGVSFRYDFYIPGANLLIEYQGDYWHANPRRYKPGTLLNFWSRTGVKVDDIWQRDAEKKLQAEAAGFQIIHIWEMDFNRDGLDAVMSENLKRRQVK